MQEYRKKILQLLDERRSGSLTRGLDSEDLAQRMGLSWDEIQPEVAYLEEKGYLASKGRQIGTRVFHTLHITAKGIDLLEGRVNDSTVIVYGDLIHTTVGNNAHSIAIGKGVTLQHLADDKGPVEKLDSALQGFLNYLDESSIGDHAIVLKQQATELRELLRRVGLMQ